jgi:type III secretion system YscD/HrpQ family protein
MYLIAEKGLLKGLHLKLEDGEEWFLGRDPNQVTFVLDDPSLAERAVRIHKTPEELLFIENLGDPDSVLINGRRIEEPVLLSENDRVQIGATQFRASQTPSETQNAYDDLFGSLENPEIPPEPEPVEERVAPSSESPEEQPAEQPPREKTVKEQREERIQNAYDTIFEELGQEDSLPFQLTAEEPKAPFLLKVIAGPNAGAEIPLQKGSDYLIGKDAESCDIAFYDLSVSRTHARLTLSEEGIIEIEDLGSKNGTIINGSRITERSALTTQHMVQMGTTIFLIIDLEAAQETIYAPPPYEVPQHKPPEEIAAELEEAEQLEAQEEDWKSKKIPSRHLIYAGSFCLTLFVIGLTFFSLFKSEPVELVHKTPHESLKELFAHVPAVHYSYNPATGKLFLTGHQLTHVEHQELLYTLRHHECVASIEDAVVIDETIWKMMSDLLSINPAWRSVSVLSSQPGQFVARGYVPNLESATQLSHFFTNHFPYLDRLQNRVVMEDMMIAEIATLLQAKGFGSVAPQLSNGEVILVGRYSEKDQSAYHRLLSHIAKIDGVASVKNGAIPVSPLAASINLTDQYQVTGTALQDHKGYGVVVNGRIITIGDALDGMKLVSIEPNTILLEKDGLRYKIDYVQ